MDNPTNFKVGKVDDSIDSIMDSYRSKADEKGLNVSPDEFDQFEDKLEHIDENTNSVEEKAEMINEYESDPEDHKEEEDSDDDSEKSYGGIGGGRRKKLDKIEEFDRLKKLEKSDIQSKEDIEKYIKEMKVPSVATARGSYIEMDDLLDRLDKMYNDLPEDAQSHYVNDTKLFRTLRSARRHFNKLVDRKKRFAEMPSAMEAGPANYPTNKRDKRRDSVRSQQEKLEEKIDRLNGRLKGARQRALNKIGSSVGEQNEKKRQSQREKILEVLEVGDLVKFMTPAEQVGRVKRLNKKSVTFELFTVKHTGPIGSGETEERVETYRQDLPTEHITWVDVKLGDEALEEITVEDFDKIHDMDESKLPDKITVDFLEDLRDDEEEQDEEEETKQEDKENVSVKRELRSGDVKEYNIRESKVDDIVEKFKAGRHSSTDKEVVRIEVDGEEVYNIKEDDSEDKMFCPEDGRYMENDHCPVHVDADPVGKEKAREAFREDLKNEHPEVPSDLIDYAVDMADTGDKPLTNEKMNDVDGMLRVYEHIKENQPVNVAFLDESDFSKTYIDDDSIDEAIRILEDGDFGGDGFIENPEHHTYVISGYDGDLEPTNVPEEEKEDDSSGMNEKAVKELTRRGTIVEKDAAEMIADEDVERIQDLDTPPMYLSQEMLEVLRENKDVVSGDFEVSEIDSDKDLDYKKIEFMTDTPEFTGVDMDTYGPYSEGDKDELPKDNAQILINRGNAEEVEDKSQGSKQGSGKSKEKSQSSDDGSSVKKDEDEEYIEIEFVQKTPEFMGTDLNTYGPFEEGDTAEIPEENAEILVNRGNAERLNGDFSSGSGNVDHRKTERIVEDEEVRKAMEYIGSEVSEEDSSDISSLRKDFNGESSVFDEALSRMKSEGELFEPAQGKIQAI